MRKYMKFSEVFKKSFLSWPKVGESVEFVMDGQQIVQGDEARNWGKNGFDICLSGVDYGVVIYDIEGRDMPVRSWEVHKAISEIGKKIGTDDGKNMHLKIVHLKDGTKSKNEQLYDVFIKIDGSWKKLDKNREWTN
jgi:hypothetical protein